MARISFEAGELDEVLAQFRDEIRLVVREELAASNGHGEVGWFDAKAAAVYLSLSEGAVDRAMRRGTIESVVTANGRRRSSREMLDRYATAKGNGR